MVPTAHPSPSFGVTDGNYWTRQIVVNKRLLRCAIALLGRDDIRARELFQQRVRFE